MSFDFNDVIKIVTRTTFISNVHAHADIALGRYHNSARRMSIVPAKYTPAISIRAIQLFGCPEIKALFYR